MLPDFSINIAGDNQSLILFDAATCASVTAIADVISHLIVSACVRHFLSGFFNWTFSNSCARCCQLGHRCFGSCFDVRIVHTRSITNIISNVLLFLRYVLSAYYQRKLTHAMSAFQDGEASPFASISCFQLHCNINWSDLEPISTFLEGGVHVH